MANGHLGLPRNLGDPVVSSAKSRLEILGQQLQASAAHSSAGERKERVNAEVPPKDGNEVRWDRRQEVVALDSTVEAGELAPEDPVEGSEASVGSLDRGKHAEHIEVHPHVRETRTDSHGDLSGAANLSAE
jgi:hypothetical protein